jgi:hypothetical protein
MARDRYRRSLGSAGSVVLGLNLYVTLAHDDLAHLDAIEAIGLHLRVQADEWSGNQALRVERGVSAGAECPPGAAQGL